MIAHLKLIDSVGKSVRLTLKIGLTKQLNRKRILVKMIQVAQQKMILQLEIKILVNINKITKFQMNCLLQSSRSNKTK